MKQILSRTLLLIVVIAAIFGLSSCKIFVEQEPSTYDLVVNNFERSVVYGSELDLSGLDIEVTTAGEVKHIAVTRDMITSGGKTDSVGDHEMVIEYGGYSWPLYYEVFYKIDHIVDGFVYDSQMVMSRDELLLVKDPKKENSIFIGWNQQIPDTLTGNLRIEAMFADGLTLPEFTATYGDTLANLTLPEAKDGHWEWKDSLDTSVGNAGTNKFTIAFIPDNPAAKRLEFVVDVEVAKKKLEFTILNDKFEYDGNPHSIDYELSDGVDPSKVNIVCFGTEHASDIGVYNYNLRIFDQNYEGQIKGSFEITKIKLIVDVLLQDGDSYDSDVTITYGDPFPDYKVVIKDKNGKDYVLGEALAVSVDKPSMLIAGYYDILATIKDVTDDNNNDLRYYDISYNVAKLVVAGVDFDPGPPLLKENYDIYYGDLLSSIEFADHPNGVWVWDYTYNAFAVADSVGNAGKNTFRAEFIPKDSSYNKSEAYIVLDVNKKVLTINVDPASTTVVYDGKEHGLSYVVVDPATGRVFDNLIVTGDVKYVEAYENGYNITLSIDDANYTGSLSTTLKIRKADPITDFSKVITLTWRSNLKLENIALDAGYEWKYKNTTIDVAGEYIFDVVFTPEDTDNYNVINGKVKVIVEKAQSSITGLAEKYDTWIYNGSDFELNKTFFGYESVGGTVKYLYNGSDITALKNAGEYFIKMVIEENDNYLGCEVSTTVVINKADPQITQLSITGWTYGEESNDPSAKTTFGNIVYKYYIKGSEGYVLFGEDGLTAPTEAGTYYVHATVAATNDWNGAESIYKEFKIDKQIVELPEIENIVYQGKLIKPTVPESDLYSVAANGNEGGENVGEYKVTLVLADSDNYRWEGLSSATATVKYKITKYNSNVIKDFDGGKWTYEDTVSHSTEATFGKVSYTYYLKNAKGEYEKVDEAKNAGEYKVEARVAQTDNYNGCSLEKTFVIDKKSVEVPSLSDDQLSFVYSSKTITSGFKAPEGAYYKVSDVGGKEVGDYYVTLTLNTPSNYEWDDNKGGAERKLKYSITKDEVSITKLTIENWKYKGTINSHIVEIDRTYTSANIVYQYKTPGGEWVDTTITRNSVAGDYRVVATVADTTNYDGDVEIVEFKINKADNATINNIITGKKYTTVYNKDASYTIPGLSGSHTESTLTYTITKNGASVTEMKNAGTYTVVITLPESDNYEEVSETVTVEISKKEISKPTLSSVSNTYNGGTFVPTPSSSDDYDHAFENEASIAAGTYKVTFTLTDANYVWDPDIVWESGTAGILTYTIQKANIGIEGNTSNRNNVPYTLAGYTLTDIVAKGVNVESTLVPTITLGGEEVDAITGVGTYTVTYNYNDTTGNYNNRKVEFTVNITKATNRFTSNPAGGKSWTYGNVVDTTVFGAKASFGEVKYRFFSDAEGNNPLTVTSETRLGYGTYYVQAYVDDNSDNYDDCESSIVAFNITKATATISGVISSATSVYGQYAATTKDQLVANSSVTLAYGSAVKPTVTVIFTPVSGGTATPADTIYNAGTYVVTYCYVDDNHNSVTETATVFIDRADTTIDVVESVSKDYDNTEYVLPVTVKINGVDITLGENGLTYVITKNGTPVDEIKNAGTYTITYTYAGDANYKAGTDATTVVVDKVTPSITHGTDHGLVYNANSVTYNATATASGVEIDKDKYISVTYYTKSGDKYTPINAPAGKGTYYYLVTVAEGENWYSGNTGYVEFTVTCGQANITGFATTAHQYNSSVAPLPTAYTNLGNVYYYFKSATKSGAKFERWTATNGPKDADTYIVYAEVIDDVNDNYLGDKTAEINYVITPASTIITAGNIGKTYGFSYTTLESLIGATYKNVGNVDATAGLKYEITGGDTDKLKDGKIVNVGSYKVTVTLTDTNYTAAPVEITVTVSPKSATITATNKETYYKGGEYTIDEIKSLISASIDGIVAGDSTELTYTVSGGKTIENQGAYEVIVSYTSDNYTVISVPVTVTVKPATTSIIANNVNKTYGFTYESLESLISATYKDTSGADATANLKYEITGGDINKLVNGNIVNAGTYTVTVSLTDTNYTAAPTEVTVYVAPKGFSGTVTVNATYDDKLSDVELPVVEGGHLEWHNSANKVGTVGNQKWLARFVADNSGNYANVENVSITVVVSTKFVTKPIWAMNQTFDYDAVTSHSAVITNLVDAAYYDIAGNGNVAANEDGYIVTITLKSSHGNNIEWVGGTSEVLSFKYYVTKASTSIAIEGFAQNSNNTYATDLGKYDPTRTYTIPAGTVALKDGTTATAGYTVKYIPNVGDTVEDFKGDIKAAGTYIITYTYAGNSNHSASSDATLTVTIGKADSSVVITPATGDSIDANNKISVGYNGNKHLPTVTINGVITNYSADKYVYAKPEGFSGAVTEIIGETAGTYTLVYSLTNDNNYADISKTVTLVIAQVENNDEITVATDARFDDKVLSKITLPGNANGSWSLVIVGVTTNTSVDADTVFKEVTTYTYKATFTSDNVNYADDYREGTIFVDKKLVTEPTVDDIVYTGDWIYPDPKIEGPYTVTANAGGKNHNTDPKAYYVEFTLDNPETHEWSKASNSINDIDGAKIKVYYDITNIVNKWKDDQSLAIEGNKWTYNFGETIPVPTAMPNEGTPYIQFRIKGTDTWIDWAHYDLTTEKWITIGNAPENNGTYEIRAIVYADNDKTLDEATDGKGNNYDRLVSATQDLVINKATVTIDGITIVGGNDFEYLTYTAQNTSTLLNGVSLKSDVTGGTVEGTVSVNVKYVPVIGNTVENYSGDIKNAGTYTIVYTFDGTNTNYVTETETIVITIKQSAASINGANDSYSHVYDSDVYVVPGITPSHNEGTLVPTVTKGGASATLENVGTYKVTYTLAETNNYYAATPVEVTVTITPASATITALDKEFEYNGTAYDTNEKLHTLIGTSVTGIIAGDPTTLTYTVSDNKTIENHGTYTVTIVLDDPNYGVWNAKTETYDKVTETVTVNVLKKNVSIKGIASGATVTKVYCGSEGYAIEDIIGAYFKDVNGDEIKTGILYNGKANLNLANANEDGYKVTISLDNNNYKAASITVKVVIEKAEATISLGSGVVNNTVTKTYEAGTSYDLATLIGASASYNGQPVSGINYYVNGVATESLSEVNEEGHIVTVMLDNSNYKATSTVTFVIERISLVVPEVTGEYIYTVENGVAKVQNLIFTSAYDVFKDLKLADGTSLVSVSGHEESQAGESYNVVFTLNDTAHYKWVGVEGTTATAPYSIGKATPVITVNNVTANSDNKITLDSREYGSAGYADLPDVYVNEVYAGKLTGTITDAKTYTFTYTAEETDNYSERTVTVTIEITKAENNFTINPAENKSWSYGNVVDTTVFGAKAIFGTEVKYRFFADAEGNNPIEVTSETRLGYGTYYVQAYVDDNSGNYDDCESSIVAFNITKGTATISGAISSATSVYGQYAETTKDQLVANSSVTLAYGSAEKPEVTIMFKPIGGNTATSVDTIYGAGTYEVTYSYEDDNHNKATVGDITIVINKATPTVTVESVAADSEHKITLTSREYDADGYAELPEVLVNGASFTGTPTIKYQKDSTSDWKNGITEITDAGTYVFTYTVKETPNYSERTVTVTLEITKAENNFTINPAENKSWSYGNVVDTTVFGAKAIFGTEVKYRFFADAEGNNPIEVTSETRLGYGTYYVQAYVDDNSGNYDDCESSIVAFNITKGTATISGAISSATSVYGQYAETTKDQLVANSSVTLAYGSAEKPEVTIMFKPIGGNTATSVDTIYAAGTYVVTYSYEDDNHNEVTVDNIVIVIDKAAPTVTVEGKAADNEDKITLNSREYGAAGYANLPEVLVNGASVGNLTGEITDAKIYNFTYTVKETPNYSERTVTVTLVITKAKNNFTIDPAVNQSWTYGEVVDTTKFGAKALFGTEVKYRFFTDAEGKNAITETPLPYGTDGTYYVQAYVDDNSNNYENCQSSIVAFRITKKPTAITLTGDGIVEESTNKYKYDFGSYTGAIYRIPTGTVALANGSEPVTYSEVSYTPWNGTTVKNFTGDIQAAGTYVITYTYAGDDNHAASENATLTVTIGKAAPVITIGGVTVGDDNKHDLGSRYYGSDGYADLPEVKVNGVSVGNLSGTVTSADSYTFTYEAAESANYSYRKVTVTLEITKAIADHVSITATGWTNAGGQFDSAINYPTVTVKVNDLTLDASKYAVYYSTSKTEGWDTALPESAGTYYVRVVVAEDTTNYPGKDVTFTGEGESFTITKKPAGEIPLGANVDKNNTVTKYYAPGTSYDLATEIGASVPEGVDGTIKYYDVNGKEITSLSDANVNGHIVTVRLVSDNHYAADKTVTFIINQKATTFTVNDNNVVEVDTDGKYLYSLSRNYGAEGYAAPLAVKVNGASFTGTPTIKYQASNTSTWEDVTKITDAGTYVFTYVHNDTTGNYTNETLVVTLTVNTVDPDVEVGVVEGDENYFDKATNTITVGYDGKNHLPTVTINGSEVDPSDISYTPAVEGFDATADGINSGVYVLTYTFGGAVNHNPIEVTVTLTITRLESNNVEIDTNNTNNHQWTYGETPDYSVNGTTPTYYRATYDAEGNVIKVDGKIVYSETPYTIPTGGFMAAGHYKAVAQIAETVNYPAGDATQEFTVLKKQLTVINGLSDTNTTYGEYTEVPYNTVIGNIETGGVKLQLVDGSSITPDITFTYNGNTHTGSIYNAGTYVITYSLPSAYADNYAMSTVTVTIMIDKATPILDTTVEGVYYENLITVGTLNWSNNTNSPTFVTKKLLESGEYKTVITSVSGVFTMLDITYSPTAVNGVISATFVYTFTPTGDNKDNFYSIIETEGMTCSINLKAVAKINNSDTSAYGTIEKAITNASGSSKDVVWVVPDATGNVIIKENITVNSGITLLLPYLLNNVATRSDPVGVAKASSSDVSAIKNTKTDYCTSIVTLAEGKKIMLTSGSTLEISGRIGGGSGGADYSGATVWHYAELRMEANSRIESDGNIMVEGFITESSPNNQSKIIVNSGNVYQPFVVRDFNGGSFMYKAYNKWNGGLLGWSEKEMVSFFSEFQFINIQVEITIKYGANMIGWANLFAGSQNNAMPVTIIGTGTNSLIQFTDAENSSLTAKLNAETEVLDLDIYGGAKLNGMSLNISYSGINVSVKTAETFFPVCWAFDISLNATAKQKEEGEIAQYNVSSMLKIMWGAKFSVEEGAKFTVSNLNIYSCNFLNPTSAVQVYADQMQYDETAKTWSRVTISDRIAPAVFIVRGELEATKLGGNIYSDTPGAVVKVTTNNNSSPEMITTDADTQDISLNAVLYTFTRGSDPSTSATGAFSIASNTRAIYSSNYNKWVYSVKIEFVPIAGTAEYYSVEIESESAYSSGATLTVPSVPANYRPTEQFVWKGWQIDGNTITAGSTITFNGGYVIYAYGMYDFYETPGDDTSKKDFVTTVIPNLPEGVTITVPKDTYYELVDGKYVLGSVPKTYTNDDAGTIILVVPGTQVVYKNMRTYHYLKSETLPTFSSVYADGLVAIFNGGERGDISYTVNSVNGVNYLPSIITLTRLSFMEGSLNSNVIITYDQYGNANIVMTITGTQSWKSTTYNSKWGVGREFYNFQKNGAASAYYEKTLVLLMSQDVEIPKVDESGNIVFDENGNMVYVDETVVTEVGTGTAPGSPAAPTGIMGGFWDRSKTATTETSSTVNITLSGVYEGIYFAAK